MSFNIPGMSEIQEHAIFVAGLTLHAVQTAEFTLNGILTWVFPKETPIDLAGLVAMSSTNRHKNIRRLLTDLRKRTEIDPAFDVILERFVDNRNRFDHRLFSEEECSLDTDTGCNRAIDFMVELQEDAKFVQQTAVSFIVLFARSTGDPKLVDFAKGLIEYGDKPYDIIAGSDRIFIPKNQT